MELPPLTHGRFLLLSALLDDKPRSSQAISTAVNAKNKWHFIDTLRWLHLAGLVSRHVALRQCEHEQRLQRKTYTDRGYTITPKGRQWWNETLDWYIVIGNAASATAAPEDAGDTILSLRPLPPVKRPSQRRLPTPAEERRLLSHANPQFAELYWFVRHTDATITQLTELDVSDVDLDSEAIALRPCAQGPQRINLTHELRQRFAQASGERTAGPLFVNPTGRRWTSHYVSASFSTCRKRAGLSREIVLRGVTKSDPTSVKAIQRRRKQRREVAAAKSKPHSRHTTATAAANSGM